MMRSTLRGLGTIGVAVAAFLFSSGPARAASNETVLHSFNAVDGLNPAGDVVFDKHGNLYGATSAGGTQDYGTVYEISPLSHGRWSEKVLHSFGKGSDGELPMGVLARDAAGTLYGVTYQGGTFGRGTVFAVTCRRTCKERVLHSFTGGLDGSFPQGGLIADSRGNLYGTTTGAPVNDGNVFMLTRGRNGQWTENVLHAFSGGADGSNPTGTLVFDGSGNLYGTAANGGICGGAGTVYRLTRGRNDQWTFTTVHEFCRAGGAIPYAGVVMDNVGNLFGTTWIRGDPKICSGQGCGVVYEIAARKDNTLSSRPTSLRP